MDFRLLPFAVVVLALSGCIGQTITGSGLVIEDFSPDFASVFPGEEVHIDVKVRNLGTVDAQIRDIQMTGLDTKNWKMETSNCNELLRNGINAGGSASCTIALVSPETNGLEMSFTPNLHLTYSYRTVSVALVSIGTLDEARRISMQGGTIPYQTQSTTGGPVVIDIKASSPVRVSDSSVDFPIRVTVSSGSGTVCSGGCNENTWNKVRISMDSSLKSSDCPREMELSLFKGQSNAFVCNMKASPSDAGAGITQKRIEISSD
ncbi:MAG: hypothetical protein ABIH90_03095, partial [Candidatus Aenigmatarchaeota archaeon]